MKKCKVIIGKNFGDEGKGKLVDFWAKHLTQMGERVLVIRNNGGAQAGHTVEEKEFRFVFHQLGSGSYRGCDTFLGNDFFVDLWKLSEEVEEFEAISGRKAPRIYAVSDSLVVVPFDVLINSLLESSRGMQKHGSCGMGIYEARRRKEAGYGLTLLELAKMDEAEIEGTLFQMREEYVAKRLQEISVDKEVAGEWLELLADDNIVQNYAKLMYHAMHTCLRIVNSDRISMEKFLKNYDTLLFENAQGLMLDEENTEYFPHLTPSHTGLFNVRKFWERYGLNQWVEEAEVNYVTRSYVTRHGNGRLDFECSKEQINADMVDLTNVPNPWQDALRYAYHPSGAAFWRAILKDLDGWEQPLQKKLFVTHLDETREKMLFADGEMEFAEFCKQYRETDNCIFEIERLDEV